MLTYHQFKIQQLRLGKMILALETIAVYIFSIMVTIFLPSLLYQFVYADQQLLAEPPVMKYIPVASFGVAVLFSLYAIIMCWRKYQQIRKMENELAAMPMNEVMPVNKNSTIAASKTTTRRKQSTKKSSKK